MFSKFELIGAGFCVALIATIIYLSQAQDIFNNVSVPNQPAAVVDSGVIVVSEDNNVEAADQIVVNQSNDGNNINNMKIDDIKVGEGAAVKEGDVVSVHYAGRLQEGTEFDNSKKRGVPFEFQVGGGQVIKGWEEGLIGMKVGGERVLVIPPEMGYGDQGIGPIPGGATLIFTIELLDIR